MKRSVFLLLLVLCAACTARRQAPLIGISCSRSATGAAQLASAYTEAVSGAGGVAFVIPTVGTPEQAAAVLARLDGVVFSGGEDVAPAMYGEAILNETVHVDSLRDRSDSLLARAALSSGKPILAICRGEQLMNVILGGTLYQDLPTQVGLAVVHGGGAAHRIGLEPDSILAGIYGPDSLSVNSFHHQAVKDPAPGIRITARSADGIVEAFETAQVCAVQFHPEKMLQDGDASWSKLFSWFVRRCGR